jgi:hypothetical protein
MAQHYWELKLQNNLRANQVFECNYAFASHLYVLVLHVTKEMILKYGLRSLFDISKADRMFQRAFLNGLDIVETLVSHRLPATSPFGIAGRFIELYASIKVVNTPNTDIVIRKALLMCCAKQN